MLDTVVVPDASVPASWRGWAGFRVVLLTFTPLILLATVLWGEHAATLGDLQDDVARGQVSRVQVVGGLDRGSSGTAAQGVRWSSGWSSGWHHAQVQLTVGVPQPTTTVTDDHGSPLPVTDRDAGELVHGWDPQVRVDRARYVSGVSYSATVLGVQVPGWVGVLVLVQWLGALFLLVHGAEPRWVSRWGWFWLSALPFGVTVFLLSSGPLPGRRPVPPGPRRWGGGKAFVVSLLVASALGGSGGLWGSSGGRRQRRRQREPGRRGPRPARRPSSAGATVGVSRRCRPEGGPTAMSCGLPVRCCQGERQCLATPSRVREMQLTATLNRWSMRPGLPPARAIMSE
ncbi:hypothetical protein GCM10027519_33830 [Kineococcus endophyticus]